MSFYEWLMENYFDENFFLKYLVLAPLNKGIQGAVGLGFYKWLVSKYFDEEFLVKCLVLIPLMGMESEGHLPGDSKSKATILRALKWGDGTLPRQLFDIAFEKYERETRKANDGRTA